MDLFDFWEKANVGKKGENGIVLDGGES